MTASDEKPRKAEAAPLEGVLGPEIARVLNFAFLGMSAAMCLQLANTLSPHLQNPLLEQNGLQAAELDTKFKLNPATQPSLPRIEMSAPKPFAPM